MREWAIREIELAKEKNNDGYASVCLDSAFKAFESLLDDEHSGYSIHVTQNLLNRLIDGKCLTAIEDTEDVWTDIGRYDEDDNRKRYQCNRMSSLFKEVGKDGTIEYSDVDRFTFIENNSNTSWHFGLADRIGEELYPIKMPYYALSKPYIIRGTEILTDTSHGDFDTVHIIDILSPDGTKVVINRYFREFDNEEEAHSDKAFYGWLEIDKSEWDDRYARRLTRK